MARTYQVGKCLGCGTTFRWDKEPKVQEARCPNDELPLRLVFPSRMPSIERSAIREMEGEWMKKSIAQGVK